MVRGLLWRLALAVEPCQQFLNRTSGQLITAAFRKLCPNFIPLTRLTRGEGRGSTTFDRDINKNNEWEQRFFFFFFSKISTLLLEILNSSWDKCKKHEMIVTHLHTYSWSINLKTPKQNWDWWSKIFLIEDYSFRVTNRTYDKNKHFGSIIPKNFPSLYSIY